MNMFIGVMYTYKRSILYSAVCMCLWHAGDIYAQEVAHQKGDSWIRGLFKKETGLVAENVPTKPASGPLKLEDCINIAIENNMPLKIAHRNIKLAEMRVFEARRNFLPSAAIVFEESSGRVNGRRYVGRKQYIEGQQPIFHGGELYYGNKQAEVNLEVTRHDYNRAKNDLILQVKKAYYSFEKAKENRVMQKGLSVEVEKVFEMVSKSFANGTISKLEMLNVASQSGQIRFQLASAEGDVSVAELILKQAMNMDPKEDIDIEANLEFNKIIVDYEKALAAALLNRPEVKVNTLMTDYYIYGVNMARAKGWMKLDFMGQWGHAKEEFVSQDLGQDPDRKLESQWYAGIKGSMPFWGNTAEYSYTKEEWTPVVSAFQGTESITSQTKAKLLDKLDYYSDKELAEIDLDKQRQELSKARQDIILEVKEACFGYEKALIQLDTAANKVKYQESDLEFTRLKRGMDEIQDSAVIEGMIKLAQEKFGYVQALTDCHTTLASINKAIGIEDYYKDEVMPKQGQSN